jgi:hypothetical protein
MRRKTDRSEEVMTGILTIELASAVKAEIRLHAMSIRRCTHSLATARDRKERSTANDTWHRLLDFISFRFYYSLI